MSLNPSEQRLFKYIQANLDEGQFWRNKVRQISLEQAEIPMAVRRIEIELRRYYRERADIVPTLREAFEREGARVSLLNLSEYLIRMWGPPPKPKKTSG